ncbi:MAG: MoxR family ATPase [Hespellia sp.]|nr:MoxR family ATPase [Hespellia sp.]
MEEYRAAANNVIAEVSKAIVGKEQEIQKTMMAILAGGHILVEDMPGVGKTTMAVAFARALGLVEKRVQFTPDVLPSDLTGFTIYKKELGKFAYQPGAVMCNLLLADEINRTSPKTQSALLEVMEEKQVTVDGITRKTGEPFVVIATQNPSGSAGTQLLPESQMDRFMICLKMGYPTVKEEAEILKRNQLGRATEQVGNVIQAEALIAIQQVVEKIYVHDRVYLYIAQLAKATREKKEIEMGMSPRGTIALCKMAKAGAFIKGRDYVIPEDVKMVFADVAAHRMVLTTKARVGHIRMEDLLQEILEEVETPALKRR